MKAQGRAQEGFLEEVLLGSAREKRLGLDKGGHLGKGMACAKVQRTAQELKGWLAVLSRAKLAREGWWVIGAHLGVLNVWLRSVLYSKGSGASPGLCLHLGKARLEFRYLRPLPHSVPCLFLPLIWWSVLVCSGCMTKYHSLGVLKQQTCIPSRVLEAGSPRSGASRAGVL